MSSTVTQPTFSDEARPSPAAPAAAVGEGSTAAAAAPYALAFGLLCALAWPMLRQWWWEYTQPESYYGHAPIIPAVVALMLWSRRERLRAVPKRPAPLALLALVPALALLVCAVKADALAVESLAFFLTVWSAVALALGGRFLRAAAFPLGFLVLMAPLPGPALNDATLHIQMLSTVLANKLLHLMAFQTVLDGNVIHLDNYALFVDVPCSGFKLLLSMATFSAAFAYLVDGGRARRVLLFLASLPLAVLVNAVRIALIAVVGECLGDSAAHVFHDWSGLITLVLGFFVLFSMAKVAGCRKFAGWDIF